jgi:hypothetical protein
MLTLIMLSINFKETKMTYFENLYWLYLLFLINNAGLIFLNRTGSALLNRLTSDPLTIKNHRKLKEKYGFYVETYILNQKNYYILDENLATEILEASPSLFDAGILKKSLFTQIMPKNVGIAPCSIKQNCPWKTLRTYNDNILGMDTLVNLNKRIYDVLSVQINPPFTIDDWSLLSLKITASILYGEPNNYQILKEFYVEYKKPGFLTSEYYQRYVQNIKLYIDSPNSLLSIMTRYKNKLENYQVFLDQIPHIFAPTIFMINFLIPQLMAIILNFKDIQDKITDEINRPNFDIFAKNTYFHFCIIEHIRMFNTININIQRTVKYETKLSNGLELYPGEQLFILFSSILRNSEKFSKPDEFIPERWSGVPVKEQDIVFGIGNQKCTSVNFTPLIYKHVVYYLLKNYNLFVESPILKTKEIHNINPYSIIFRNNIC